MLKVNKSLKKSKSISGILGWVLTFFECPPPFFPPFRSKVSAALKWSFPNHFVDITIRLGSREEKRGGEGEEGRGREGEEESLRKGGEEEMSKGGEGESLRKGEEERRRVGEEEGRRGGG